MLVPEKKVVNDKVIEIIKLCLYDNFDHEAINSINNVNKLLQLIISNSKTSISLIVLLEDEFDIGIDDDEICWELFQSVDNLIAVINRSLQSSSSSSLY